MASGPGQELPTGHGFWGSWGAPGPLLPPVPGTSPALHCYCWLPPEPGLLPRPVPGALPPLFLPGPPLCAPLFTAPGAVEEPSRARASAASRESTAALKAWLGRHRRNPYPSRAEKALLALAARLSLAQVSTWFANARRRLRKEGRAARRPRQPPPDAPRIWRVAELATGAPPADGRPRRSRASPDPRRQQEGAGPAPPPSTPAQRSHTPGPSGAADS